MIGRIGGDEFAVLIRDPVPRRILEEKFAVLLGEVRRGLDKWYEKYKVSVSIGAVPTGGAVRDYRKLYRCADTALYISKYQGKDGFYINDKMITNEIKEVTTTVKNVSGKNPRMKTDNERATANIKTPFRIVLYK